jgi:GR25 family glycosyltransferase involved in LPS biosynthesis
MRALWQHCYTANLELVAVFEDDVIFPSDFATVFSAAYAELPDDWLVWHLHAATAGITPVGTYVARFDTTCWGAHGYLVNQRGLAKLIAITDTFDQNNTHTADDILTTCLLRAGVYPYGVIPEQTLCFQSGEFSSDIPETAALSFWRDHKNKYYR